MGNSYQIFLKKFNGLNSNSQPEKEKIKIHSVKIIWNINFTLKWIILLWNIQFS